MTDPLGPVVITGREIYDQMVRVGDAVAGLGTKVDRLADAHNETKAQHQREIAEVKSDQLDHETRIRSIERRLWPLPTLAILFSAGALVLAMLKI